ncbi:MAG: BREX-3 system P-loop-containing protein BrxF [Gammaproteobacteria bacterium]|nr:BREX-3 system P-loop-containing protein BrxF [Gammaproteobacteria bacterium]
MSSPLSHDIERQVKQAPQLYHRLILVVGHHRAGKTTALRDLATTHGWPIVNLNLVLAERLLDLTARQRTLRVARILDDILAEQAGDVVLLDNIEMLFHPDLQQDPLRLLQSLSRNRTLVATWRGVYNGRSLLYASPDHPEYRRLDDPQALIVSTPASDASGYVTFSATDNTA